MRRFSGCIMLYVFLVISFVCSIVRSTNKGRLQLFPYARFDRPLPNLPLSWNFDETKRHAYELKEDTYEGLAATTAATPTCEGYIERLSREWSEVCLAHPALYLSNLCTFEML